MGQLVRVRGVRTRWRTVIPVARASDLDWTGSDSFVGGTFPGLVMLAGGARPPVGGHRLLFGAV